MANVQATNNIVLEIYRITLLSNGVPVTLTISQVLEIYRITLLSNRIIEGL